MKFMFQYLKRVYNYLSRKRVNSSETKREESDLESKSGPVYYNPQGERTNREVVAFLEQFEERQKRNRFKNFGPIAGAIPKP